LRSIIRVAVGDCRAEAREPDKGQEQKHRCVTSQAVRQPYWPSQTTTRWERISFSLPAKPEHSVGLYAICREIACA